MTEAAINQDMKALIPKPPLTSEYLWAWLKIHEPKLHLRVGKSTHDTRKLETDALLSLPIHVPDLKGQLRLIDDLQSLLATLETLARSRMEVRSKFQQLSASLSSEAFRQVDMVA